MSTHTQIQAALRPPLFFSGVMTEDTQALSRGLRGRDPDLLDQLIEQYQHRLFRYLLFLTGNPALAEDLFQETWIRVLERGHQYNAKSKFESWLFAIARNLVIDVSRRKKMPSLETRKRRWPRGSSRLGVTKFSFSPGFGPINLPVARDP